MTFLLMVILCHGWTTIICHCIRYENIAYQVQRMVNNYPHNCKCMTRYYSLLRWIHNRPNELRIQLHAMWITGVLNERSWCPYPYPYFIGSSTVQCLADIILQWRHGGRDGVSNHQPHHCLPNRLFRHRSKKTSKPRVTDLCEGNSPVTVEFLAQMASKAEYVSNWWRHHE